VVALFALGFGAVAAFARGHPQVCVCVCACACVCVCVCVCVCMRERDSMRALFAGPWRLVENIIQFTIETSMTDHRNFHKISKFFCAKKGGPTISYFILYV